MFAAFGARCACCGETEKIFLTLDHIKNDGASHRIKLYGRRVGSTYALYRAIKREGFPKDRYQILCMNCNFGKQRNGGICPHQQKPAA